MSVDKITNNDINALRKQSKSITHIYNYPIVKEIDDFLLSIYIINYFATLFSKLVLDFKENILNQYFKFIIDTLNVIDEFIDIYILSNIDRFLPFIKSTHLKDLYPWVVLDNLYKYILNQYNEVVLPTVTNISNSILSPINSYWSKLNDEFLPKTIDSIKPEPPINTEFNKSLHLANETYGRSLKLVENKYATVKTYPTKISNLYNENLSKSNQNIPKALINTSLDISNKTLSNFGIQTNDTLDKLNGNANGSNTIGESSGSNSNGSIPKPNDEISVGA